MNRVSGIEPIIAEARKRWNRCDEAEDQQRRLILEAKKFRAGDQWPSAIRLQREGATSIQGQAAQPPRPCLTIDRLSQPVRQISNTIKSANFAIDVLPNGHGADDDTAEIFKGYIRRVQNLARGESPIEWAADQAIEGGIGWFRIKTDYVHERWNGNGPPDISIYDQELRLARIANNLTVYCDPSATRPTRSDAQFMFVTEDLDRDEYKHNWPKSDVNGIDDFAASGDTVAAKWVSDHMIRIAEYWRITYTDEVWAQLPDGRIVRGQDIPNKVVVAQKRTMRTPKVEWYKINAVEILEQGVWLGSRIPLIPILGEELNVDGRPLVRGVIQEGMDAQRMINYTYSGAMEIFALAPKTPWVAAAGQLDQYKNLWQTANIYNHAYLPYDPISIAGTLVSAPVRQTAEAPIEAAVALMQKSEECVKATTLLEDPALGAYKPQEHSGKAIEALQARSDLNASLYPSNVSRALVYAGELMVEVIPKITRPGQVLQIIGSDEEPDQVIAGQPFQPTPNGPQPSPEGVTPAMAKMQGSLHQFYDLNAGTYAVTVVAGKASATKREEGAAALGELIPHLPPEMAMILTPEYIKLLAFEGSQHASALAKKALPPPLQDQGDNGQPNPQVLQAKMAQMQQMHDMLAKELEAKTQIINTDQVKAQHDLDRAKIDQQTRIEVARIQQEGAFAVADLKAGVEAANTAIAEMQELRKAFETTQEHIQAAREQGSGHAHELIAAEQEHRHTLQQNAQEHAHELEAGVQAHAQALEQGKQAADLAPEPQVGA